jgi:leader peptidase (prepilin peptidase)/N-methyltransferase
MPRDKSIVHPPSACPGCGKEIRFYDNIPLISWLILGRKCRYCKIPISPRYFIIELITALAFTGLFFLYFHTNFLVGIGTFTSGGWLIYLLHIILIASFIAASAIDLELWVIPLCLCWFVTLVGIIGSGVGPWVIDFNVIRAFFILPSASTNIAALSAGSTIGLVVSMLLLSTGLIKRSYESEDEQNINHRLEVCREIVFLLPIVIGGIAAYQIINKVEPIYLWWLDFSQIPVIAGVLGAIWGYFVGCGVVWVTRILGTLAFGKEAMGLGDVHLMGAAGAIVGPVLVVIAFFIAPFFGLAWALFQMFFKKVRQIPYGPFLSLGIFVVMIFHDRIYSLIFQYLIFNMRR